MSLENNLKTALLIASIILAIGVMSIDNDKNSVTSKDTYLFNNISCNNSQCGYCGCNLYNCDNSNSYYCVKDVTVIHHYKEVSK